MSATTAAPAANHGETKHRFLRHAPEVALVVGAVVLLDRLGLIVQTPVALVLGLLLAGALAISAAYSAWGADCSGRDLHRRAATQAGVLTVLVYATGWGPVLAMVHLFAVADNVKYSGARAVRAVSIWAVATTVVAQGGIQAGLVPSGLDAAPAHALALMSVLVLIFVSTRIERMTLSKEHAETELRLSEERFRSLVQQSSDVIMVISEANVTYVSPSIARVLGYSEEEALGMRYVDLIHPDDVGSVTDSVLAMIERPGSTGLIDCRLRHADGHWVPFESSCRNLLDDPRISGFVITGRDISERKALEEALEHRAFHDALTGLANRALFRDRIQQTLARAQRHDNRFGILYVDLDGFKVVNDTLGHSAGDALLEETARRLNTCIRDVDTAARLGGDEFALLVDDVRDDSGAARVAQRVLEAVRRPFHIDGKEVSIDASIGIAMYDTSGTGEELLRNADIAMYMAKSSGKGTYEIFEPEMHVAVVERLQLESDLQHAIDRDEFVLHYQPIVELGDGSIVGVEALLRWEHPERGMVSPGDFIPVAEETGLIIPIGRHVLDQACRQVVEWQHRYPSQPPLHVSVNVSMKQFSHGDLVADVREALDASGLDPAYLTLELTESALVHDTEQTVAVLHALKALGVRLAIDDFGTGYSSLAYLHRFPVDVLKIDRSFVEGMVNGSQNPKLVRAIVELGRSLKLETIAEGIEHDEELTQCRALQCNLGQGYFFARPAATGAIEELIAAQMTSQFEPSRSPERSAQR